MGKNIKSYATTQVHSPGKGREALRQKVQIFHLNMVRLNHTYYSLLNFTSKLFKIGSFGQKFKQIKQNPLNSPIYSANYAKFAPIINLFILCFRGLPRQRTLRNSSELCKFHAIHPQSLRITRNLHLLLTYLMFQTPAPAENSQEFQRIMQILHGSPTYSANHTKFTKFANIIYYVSEACPSREPSAIPANYANSTQFAHTVCESREIRTIC